MAGARRRRRAIGDVVGLAAGGGCAGGLAHAAASSQFAGIAVSAAIVNVAGALGGGIAALGLGPR